MWYIPSEGEQQCQDPFPLFWYTAKALICGQEGVVNCEATCTSALGALMRFIAAGEAWGVNLLSQEYAESTTMGLDQGGRELKRLHPQYPEMQYMTEAEAGSPGHSRSF